MTLLSISSKDECGACWSFAGVGAFEGAYKQATGYLKSFSEQVRYNQIIDSFRGSTMTIQVKIKFINRAFI